jgi:hypothetical protein
MIARVRDAFIACGGWITDFHEFSNASLCLNFEIPTEKTSELCTALRATGLDLTQENQPSAASSPHASTSDAAASDSVGTLQITFIHNEPDLIISVPPIPG